MSSHGFGLLEACLEPSNVGKSEPIRLGHPDTFERVYSVALSGNLCRVVGSFGVCGRRFAQTLMDVSCRSIVRVVDNVVRKELALAECDDRCFATLDEYVHELTSGYACSLVLTVQEILEIVASASESPYDVFPCSVVIWEWQGLMSPTSALFECLLSSSLFDAPRVILSIDADFKSDVTAMSEPHHVTHVIEAPLAQSAFLGLSDYIRHNAHHRVLVIMDDGAPYPVSSLINEVGSLEHKILRVTTAGIFDRFGRSAEPSELIDELDHADSSLILVVSNEFRGFSELQPTLVFDTAFVSLACGEERGVFPEFRTVNTKEIYRATTSFGASSRRNPRHRYIRYNVEIESGRNEEDTADLIVAAKAMLERRSFRQFSITSFSSSIAVVKQGDATPYAAQLPVVPRISIEPELNQSCITEVQDIEARADALEIMFDAMNLANRASLASIKPSQHEWLLKFRELVETAANSHGRHFYSVIESLSKSQISWHVIEFKRRDPKIDVKQFIVNWRIVGCMSLRSIRSRLDLMGKVDCQPSKTLFGIDNIMLPEFFQEAID